MCISLQSLIPWHPLRWLSATGYRVLRVQQHSQQPLPLLKGVHAFEKHLQDVDQKLQGHRQRTPDSPSVVPCVTSVAMSLLHTWGCVPTSSVTHIFVTCDKLLWIAGAGMAIRRLTAWSRNCIGSCSHDSKWTKLQLIQQAPCSHYYHLWPGR